MSLPLAQLQTQPALIDQVHDRLLAAIVDGTLEPGRRLTQDELALMLGVSRQPVSHALQMLKRRGLFVDVGKRGIAVAPLDGARISGLYQVRAALDCLAAELAAARVRDGQALPGEIELVRSALARGQKLLADGELGSPLIDADVSFHSALHGLSANAVIVETVAEQWPHFRRSMRQVLAAPAIATEQPELVKESIAARVWREHAAIFEAIVLGRASEAGWLARQHAERAAEDTVHRLALQSVQSTSALRVKGNDQ